jgi:hypothetical protein
MRSIILEDVWNPGTHPFFAGASNVHGIVAKGIVIQKFW